MCHLHHWPCVAWAPKPELTYIHPPTRETNLSRRKATYGNKTFFFFFLRNKHTREKKKGSKTKSLCQTNSHASTTQR